MWLALGGVAHLQTSSTPVPVVAPSAAPAPAGAPSARFSGLDVTILIDQSGSMWRFPQNDKYNHRIGQTKNLIYRLAEHVENTPLVHRVSVINFGDNAALALSNHVMRYDPADPGRALRETKAVVERAVTHKDWGNTNIPEAMKLALAEYAKLDAAEARPGQQRVMLLLTDGRPDVPGQTLAGLRSAIENYAATLRAQNIGFWVVGLNDASNYWNSGDGAFWAKVAGADRALLAETASTKIAALMQHIVDEWLGTQSSPFNKDDEYECPPYLRRVVFSINMSLPRSAVGVVDPDGNDIPLSGGGPGVSPGTFARFDLDDPKPGIYKLKRDPSRSYTPKVEEFSANIKRLAPAGATSLEANPRIVFQALTGKGTPLQMLPTWPITPSIVITAPDGSVEELKASTLPDGKFAAKWKARQLGTHRVRLKGLVTLKSGAPYDVFGANASSYDERLEVTNQHPYWLAFDDPDPADGFRLWRPETAAPVVLSLVDAKGARITNLAPLVKDPATWLSLQLVDPSGAPLASAPQPLVSAGNGTFSTTLPLRLDWLKGEGWWMPRQTHFRIIAQPNRVQGNNYLDSIQLTEDAEALRIASDPFAVGPLRVRFTRWILWPLALLILVLLLGLLLLLGRALLLRALLWGADRWEGRTVTVKVYNGDEDPEAYYAKKFNATGGYQFKYNQKLSVSLDGTDYVAVEFRLRREPLFDQVVVEVRYRWQHEPKKVHTVRLRKGRVERLQGLPRADYAISLEEKP